MMPSPSYVPVIPNRLGYAEATDAFPVTGTTAQTVTPLAAAVEVGRTYVVMAGIVWSCTSAAANVGLSWSGPAGATLAWNNTTGSTGYRNAIGLVDSYTGSTAEREAFLLGRLKVSSAAGSLALTLSTSDSAATATLAAGSWLMLHRVA